MNNNIPDREEILSVKTALTVDICEKGVWGDLPSKSLPKECREILGKHATIRY